MPAGGVPGVPAPEVCCDLGRVVPYHPQPPPSGTTHPYTDHLGFTYHLCARHYRVFVDFWRRLEATKGSARHQTRPFGRVWSDRGTPARRAR
jgi:hypothetical protein